MLITRLWQKHCPGATWFFLCTKDAQGEWKEHPFKRSELKKVPAFIKENLDKNLYFSPMGYSGPRRKSEYIVKPHVMWSDMDERDPRTVAIRPTIAIESSPGRYVGLWLTDSPVTNKDNKRLTYFIGADKGGWGYTKVLRIPGTINYKYAHSPRTRILWGDGDEWKLSELLSKLPAKEEKLTSSEMTSAGVLSKWRKKLSWGVVKLIEQRQPPPTGKRSEVLHRLFCECAEVGMSKDETITLLSSSVWNKFAGRSTEDDNLEREWEKVEDRAPSRVIGEKENPQDEDYRWFAKNIEDVPEEKLDWVWYPYLARKQLSILQGDPEAGKSFIAQNVAGHLCEGRKLPCYVKGLPIVSGPVCYFDLENDAALVTRARLRWSGYNLNRRFYQEEHSWSIADDETLGKITAELSNIKPVLIVFDTLMTYIGDGDTNNASSTMQIMARFKQMAARLNCAVLVLRHLTKGGRDRAMYRGTGSIAISAFARIEITAGPHPEQEDVRCIARSKGNLTAPPPALCYEILSAPTKDERDRAKFSFLEFDESVSVEQLVKPIEEKKDDGSKAEAEAFLADTLKEGPIDAEKVKRMADARNISERSLKKAFESLEIERTFEGFGKNKRTYWKRT